eukprot:scaffold5152_cov60-Attheya_sp.AAC.1
MMGWFDVGCWGLFATNLQALLYFDESSTGVEAYRLVCTTNAIMHFMWGAHNLHQFYIAYNEIGAGTEDEWRRPYPMLGWSLLGACGSGFVRNVYANVNGINDGVIIFTWVWEWLSLGIILIDFGYFLLYEHTWGMAMKDRNASTGTSDCKRGKADSAVACGMG